MSTCQVFGERGYSTRGGALGNEGGASGGRGRREIRLPLPLFCPCIYLFLTVWWWWSVWYERIGFPILGARFTAALSHHNPRFTGSARVWCGGHGGRERTVADLYSLEASLEQSTGMAGLLACFCVGGAQRGQEELWRVTSVRPSSSRGCMQWWL